MPEMRGQEKTPRPGPGVDRQLALAKPSEAEGQELSAAGGVAIHQGSEADLVGDPEAREAFHHHADHKAEHGGAAVEELSALELIHVDLLGGAVLQPVVAGGGLVMDVLGDWSWIVCCGVSCSAREIRLEQCAHEPGAEQENGEGGDHRGS